MAQLCLLATSLGLGYWGLVWALRSNKARGMISVLCHVYLLLCLLTLTSLVIAHSWLDVHAIAYYVTEQWFNVVLSPYWLLLILVISQVISLRLVTVIQQKNLPPIRPTPTRPGAAFVALLLALLLHPASLSLYRQVIDTTATQSDKHAQAKGDTKRFIAHAGGIIQHHTYTNSLEALNESYRRGFRLFELDILMTADQHFVAAHDWPHWQRLTGYQGTLPPNLLDFKKQRLLGLYQPLAMADINRWFSNHPKAILVTDKTEAVSAFAAQFVDKSRLMMELFSVSALAQAQQAQIGAALANWGIIKHLPGDPAQALQDLGVKYVAMNRQRISKAIPLLRRLSRNGIRTFVYGLHVEAQKDEHYVFCYDFDFIYGMYADHALFDQATTCRP